MVRSRSILIRCCSKKYSHDLLSIYFRYFGVQSSKVSDKMQMEAGIQPLDRLMVDAELRNNDLVCISQEGLTHKQVSKGRKGRRITKKLQLKILSAWNQLMSTDLVLDDLFNYRGR